MWWMGWMLAVAAEPFEIAVTIDDLPWAGALPRQGARRATKRVLRQLAKAGVQATAFVNCGKDDQALLALWTAAGHTLGNHTSSHHDIDRVPLDVWLADVRACHDALAARLGAPPTLFRYPYLRNGAEVAVRDEAKVVLTEDLNQTLARVTIDNHEWKLAALYNDALAARDREAARSLARFYVAHVRAAVAHYRGVARQKLGRDVKHVLLLHANTLAADHLGDVLDALREDGARFVALEVALADPVYSEPDTYVGRGGLSWLYHVRHDPTIDYSWDNDAWNDIVARFEDR